MVEAGGNLSPGGLGQPSPFFLHTECEHVMSSYCIGWFGIPGANGRGSTKTHIVRNSGMIPIDGRTAICGAKLGPRQEFQWCGDGALSVTVECEHCKTILNKCSGMFKQDGVFKRGLVTCDPYPGLTARDKRLCS